MFGRYFYNMYTCIVKQLELVFPINVKSNTITILLDFPITYRNASVLCQSECACLHKTLKMAVFFVKSHEKKGEHSCTCSELSL